MSEPTVTMSRIEAGLYEAPDGTRVENVGEEWHVTHPGEAEARDIYPRLKDAREALTRKLQGDPEPVPDPAAPASDSLLAQYLRGERP